MLVQAETKPARPTAAKAETTAAKAPQPRDATTRHPQMLSHLEEKVVVISV
jgi:hypothetical protein